MRLEQVRVALVVVAPGVLDQAAVGDDAAFVQGQHVQDAELEPRQLDRLATLGHFVRLQVEHQIAYVDLARRLAVRVGLAAAHHGLHACGELLGAEGLGHVVVGADLQAAQDVLFLVARGEHDDRGLGLVANAAADFEAVNLGQVAVEEDDVGAFAFPALQRLLAINGGEYVVSLAAQRVGHQIQKIDVVVNDQNLHRANPSPVGLRNDGQMGFRGRHASNRRNGEPESSATAAAVLDAHQATVGLDDGLDDGQAETYPIFAAARAGGGAVVRLQKPIHVFDTDTPAPITPPQTYFVTVGNDGQIDRAIGRAKLAGVQDQVDQHLAQAAAITDDLGDGVPKSDAQALAALGQERPDDRVNVLQQIDQAQRPAVQLQAAFANGRGAEQVLDQPLQPQGAAVHCPEHGLDLLRIQMQKVFGEQLG